MKNKKDYDERYDKYKDWITRMNRKKNIITFLKERWLMIILVIIILLGLYSQYIDYTTYSVSAEWKPVLFYNPNCGISNNITVFQDERCSATTYVYVEIKERVNKKIQKEVIQKAESYRNQRSIFDI